mgnify:CR=1 FL=1
MRNYLTAAEARHFLSYNPFTGDLKWKNPRARRVKPGDSAGNSNPNGYISVAVKSCSYQAHRLAWLIHYGRWPKHHIDHVNGDTRDNRIRNLREVSHAENCRNQKLHSTNSSGVVGVSWYKPIQKWRARITVNGRDIHLGCFTQKPDAIAARKAADVEYGFHPNHGRAL